MDQIVDQHPREHLVRIVDENLQQREFTVAQREPCVVTRQGARGEVEFERPEVIRLACFGRAGGRRPAPAQHRLDASEQFARIERFRQIVVGAERQADDAVRHGAACRDENHRNVVAGGAQRGKRAQTVSVRHHDVEHNDRRPLPFEAALQMCAVVEHGGIEPVRLQKAAKQIAYNRVVVDDKDLWIHLEILDWRARQTADCFLTNTYLLPSGWPAGPQSPAGSLAA